MSATVTFGALLRISLGDGAADAAPGAGHDRYLALQASGWRLVCHRCSPIAGRDPHLIMPRLVWVGRLS